MLEEGYFFDIFNQKFILVNISEEKCEYRK